MDERRTGCAEIIDWREETKAEIEDKDR